MREYEPPRRYKVQYTGRQGKSGSYVITIPKEWFARNGIKAEGNTRLLTVFNKHILILNPNDEKRVLDRVKGLQTIENVMKAILDG